MKIFTAEQIRDWDQYTIAHEPVSSTDLMERAAGACFEWLDRQDYLKHSFSVFCGKGNNGGDGLVIARLLLQAKAAVTVYILDSPNASPDLARNLERLQREPVSIHMISSEADFPVLPHQDVILECLFGTGLNRPLDGLAKALVSFMNGHRHEVISIDLPAGLFADRTSRDNTVIEATQTLTFQAYKTALLLPENEPYTGTVHVLDIGLHSGFRDSVQPAYQLIDETLVRSLYKPRKRFGHKGNYGHALLIAGSYGKMGAAVMAATACLRSGAGLLTAYTPQSGNIMMQVSLPEAMALTDIDSNIITSLPDELEKYTTIGIGPGLGTAAETADACASLWQSSRKPLVIDADALNILSVHQNTLHQLPANSILTPHPKEFERLFGKSNNDFDRLQLALEQAARLQCIIVLKGHHTFIALPDGRGYFNSTGNAGMAKGGSGDVLTGMITGLLAQGYTSGEAAILGVWLHGKAGDLAAAQCGVESMLPTDLIAQLGNAFRSI